MLTAKQRKARIQFYENLIADWSELRDEGVEDFDLDVRDLQAHLNLIRGQYEAGQHTNGKGHKQGGDDGIVVRIF